MMASQFTGAAITRVVYQTQVFFGYVILRKWNLFALVAVVFEILAFAYIRKDEETVRGLDRLR